MADARSVSGVSERYLFSVWHRVQVCPPVKELPRGERTRHCLLRLAKGPLHSGKLQIPSPATTLKNTTRNQRTQQPDTAEDRCSHVCTANAVYATGSTATANYDISCDSFACNKPHHGFQPLLESCFSWNGPGSRGAATKYACPGVWEPDRFGAGGLCWTETDEDRQAGGLPRVPAWELHTGRERLPLRSPDWDCHDRHEWEYCHSLHGLHQGEMLSGEMQVLSSPCTPAGQNQGSSTPGESKCCSRNGPAAWCPSTSTKETSAWKKQWCHHSLQPKCFPLPTGPGEHAVATADVHPDSSHDARCYAHHCVCSDNTSLQRSFRCNCYSQSDIPVISRWIEQQHVCFTNVEASHRNANHVEIPNLKSLSSWTSLSFSLGGKLQLGSL